MFCDRKCAGLGRRKGKTKEQRVAEKAEYDRRYREANLAEIKAKKAARFRATYDPEKAAIERNARMPWHVEYCRRPEYKQWKKQYDFDYRAREFGEFSEAYKFLIQIENEIDNRASRYDVAVAKGTLNKALQRKRFYVNLKRNRTEADGGELEERPLANPSSDQG